MRHGPLTEPVCNAAPVANAFDPITLVNDTDPPGPTTFVCGVAMGNAGGVTITVIVDPAVRP